MTTTDKLAQLFKYGDVKFHHDCGYVSLFVEFQGKVVITGQGRPPVGECPVNTSLIEMAVDDAIVNMNAYKNSLYRL